MGHIVLYPKQESDLQY